MMLLLLSLSLSIVFLILSLIHFNWALGGQWGFDAALPTNEKEERVLNPGKADSAIVGLGLLAFCAFYLLKAELISFDLPYWIFKYGGWIIPAIFILRAIGDFKYVGFFKKVKQTKFGVSDTKFFSPLCLAIGVIGCTIALM